MNKNCLLIASAGSGKTTYLVEKALSIKDEKILITTYTQANEAEIKRKIIKKKKAIPSNITIQTWFSLLIQHGVKPYQGALNDLMFKNEVRGLLLVASTSGRKLNSYGEPIIYNGRPLYWPESEFKKHYFSIDWRIYSDKLSKYVIKTNKLTDDEVVKRIGRIYSNIFIDEVQDLAGYDLELLKLLFKVESNILLVGDPRQVTYLTHVERKHSKYKDGKIKDFLLEKCRSLIGDGIDEESLQKSHRSNSYICRYASKLFQDIHPTTESCDCCNNISANGHNGIFLVKPEDINNYLINFNPTQLRWSNSFHVNSEFSVLNFGESKGLTFDRVLIYPTNPMNAWINDNEFNLPNASRAKFYVGLTRARFSSAIVFEYNDSIEYDGLIKYKPD
ncbi:MAG: UvrD-helicase domain-containing protein [Candidatus Babeliales bacterium]